MFLSFAVVLCIFFHTNILYLQKYCGVFYYSYHQKCITSAEAPDSDSSPERRLLDAPWYWSGISKDLARDVMMNQPERSFMVRDSTTKGDYTLLVKWVLYIFVCKEWSQSQCDKILYCHERHGMSTARTHTPPPHPLSPPLSWSGIRWMSGFLGYGDKLAEPVCILPHIKKSLGSWKKIYWLYTPYI